MHRSRALVAFVVLTLVSWLMPLGTFIRASQEGTACGGKRAFHMCHMMKGKAAQESSSTVSFSNAGSLETAKASQGAGNDALSQGSPLPDDAAQAFVLMEPFTAPPAFSATPPAPPPKQASLFR